MPEVGFHTRVELSQSLSKPFKGVRGQTRMTNERLHQLECTACPLDKLHNEHPKMPPVGNRRPALYVMGELPSKADDDSGRPLSGQSGYRLREALGEAAKYARWNNTIRCRSPKKGKKKTSDVEVECCRPRQMKDLAEAKPIAVLAAGGQASAWFGTTAQIGLWRGRRFPAKIGDTTCWVFPTYHPSFLDRGEGSRETRDLEWLFDRDVKQLVKLLPDLERPKVWTEEDFSRGNILITGKEKGAFEIVRATLERLARSIRVAFDLETWPLRPYSPGAKALAISFSDGGTTISIALDHPEAGWSPGQRAQLMELLSNFIEHGPEFLVAHNLSFDLEWLVALFGKAIVYCRKWDDTQSQAFVLDERIGGFSLDFLALLYLGVRIKSFSALNKNRLINEPLSKLLPYNAIDSRCAIEVDKKQMRRVRVEGMREVHLFHIRRIAALVLAQFKGALTDQVEVKRLRTVYEPKQEETRRKMDATTAMQTYRKRYGVFNPDSQPDIRRMFENVLECPEGKTEDGGYTTKEEVLELIKHPMAKLILSHREFGLLAGRIRRLDRTERDTYVHGDGLIHTHYRHTNTVTSRTSSDDPALQNFPKRRHREARAAFCARPGNRLIACDQGQGEARVIAARSGDVRFQAYIRDRKDVHWEYAWKFLAAWPRVLKRFLAAGDKHTKSKSVLDKARKAFRDDVKNAFTFPEFYLASIGTITTGLHIPEHVFMPVHEEFWDEFGGIKTWQQKLLDEYKRKGYVTSATGRRRHGPLSKNAVVNNGVQGDLSDIVLDSMQRISQHAIETGEEFLEPMFNVHDDLTFDVPREHCEEATEFIVPQMLQTFDWVTVPLSVEVEQGKDWYHMNKVGTFYGDEVAT